MQSPSNAQREQLMTVPMPVSVSVSDLEANPHDLHARCRDEHPVVYVPELDAFLVTRWDDVRCLCRVSSAYCSRCTIAPLSCRSSPGGARTAPVTCRPVLWQAPATRRRG